MTLSGFPSFYSDMFSASETQIGDVRCILLELDSAFKLKPVMKAAGQIEAHFEIPCIIASRELSIYQKRRLSEEGISWISSPDTFYIPFLGMSCTKSPRFRKRFSMSPQAFRILSKYIAGELDDMSTTEVAKLIERSVSTTNDYFLELEAFFPGLVGSNGRRRFLRAEKRRDIIDAIDEQGLEAYSIRKPKKLYLKTFIDPKDLPRLGFKASGFTALSQKTIVADNPWPTFAIGRKAYKESELSARSYEVDRYDDPNIAIEIWPYEFSEREDGEILPLELWLSLLEDARQDERVSFYLKELTGA